MRRKSTRPDPTIPLVERLRPIQEEFRRLSKPGGLPADKTFFDELSGTPGNGYEKLGGTENARRDPRQTAELLDGLQRLGFTDDAFWRLHHFRQRDGNNHHKIRQHRDYCLKMAGHFRAGENNARTQERLQIVLDYYEKYHAGRPSVFPELAEAVWSLVKPLPL